MTINHPSLDFRVDDVDRSEMPAALSDKTDGRIPDHPPVPPDTGLSDTQETVECEPSAECESQQHLSPRRPALSAPGPGPRPLPGRGRPRPLRLRPGLHDELGLLPPRHCHGPAGLWRLDTIIPGRSQVELLPSLLDTDQ